LSKASFTEHFVQLLLRCLNQCRYRPPFIGQISKAHLLPPHEAVRFRDNNDMLVVVKMGDIGAYTVGRLIGRHKLAPRLSPGKTWEGVAGALATVTVYALILAGITARGSGFLVATFLGMTVFSIVGDLFESWLKRSAGVKDSGAILPGHGGMLDRIDALTSALPFAALIFA